MVRTFLKVYMELGSYFLFLQEQIKDTIIIELHRVPHPTGHVEGGCLCSESALRLLPGHTKIRPLSRQRAGGKRPRD